MTTATNQAGQGVERNEPIVANWMQDGKLCAAPSYEQLAAECKRQREVIAELSAALWSMLYESRPPYGSGCLTARANARAALAKAAEGAV